MSFVDSNQALTAEGRREVCIHEAGHAIVYALGGCFIYRVAVAPVGCKEWSTESRKGYAVRDAWGVCEPSGSPALGFITWDDTEQSAQAHRPAFQQLLRVQPGGNRARLEAYRQLRAHVCGALAGPAAEQLSAGLEPWLDEGEWGVFDDHARAWAHAWLLPWRAEFDSMAAATIEALRRPELWRMVVRLADELERRGEVAEGIDTFLPAPVPGWPFSPRAKVRRPFDVLPLVGGA